MILQRYISVSIIGIPNVGKSTLLNCIIGRKVSIVSPKIQTTRNVIRGIYTDGDIQIAFIDTPGLFAPVHAIDRPMLRSALAGHDEGDITILLIDPKKTIERNMQMIMRELSKSDKKVVVVFNKIDEIGKGRLLPLTEKIHELINPNKIFMISAFNGDGVEDLVRYLQKQAPEAEWKYPKEKISDSSKEFIAIESTREKIFNILRQELPYKMSISNESWKSIKDEGVDIIEIHQVVHVTSENHKKIIVGKGAWMLKQVGCLSRKDLQERFECKVRLFLFVKVRPELPRGSLIAQNESLLEDIIS